MLGGESGKCGHRAAAIDVSGGAVGAPTTRNSWLMGAVAVRLNLIFFLTFFACFCPSPSICLCNPLFLHPPPWASVHHLPSSQRETPVGRKAELAGIRAD